MKNSIILYIVFLCVLVLLGCKDNWDEHYENNNDSEEAGSSDNLLEYINKISTYSEFLKLMEEVDVAEELEKNQVLTVWIPSNGNIPTDILAPIPESLSEEERKALFNEKKRFVLNHINYIALYYSKLQDNKLIKMQSGKNLIITETTIEEFVIDGQKVINGNQICRNGVVHEIEGSLIPRKNIFEYLLETGDEYSIYRDSLLSKSDTVFDPDSSFPLGVDEVGNTVYDSIYVVKNPILSRGNINSEDADYTLFLPTNESIESLITEMTDLYAELSLAIRTQDTLDFYDWIYKASIYNDKIESYEEGQSFESVFGLEWIIGKQVLDPAYKEFSNGYIYTATKLYIPKSEYLPSIQTYLYYIFDDLPVERQANYIDTVGMNCNRFNATTQDSRRIAWIGGPKDSSNPVYSGAFATVTKDNNGNVIEGYVLPGKYTFYGSFRNSYASDQCNVYVNGRYVTQINTRSTGGNYAEMRIEDIEIPEEDGFNMVWIRLENLGVVGVGNNANNNNRITPYYVVLRPSADNY